MLGQRFGAGLAFFFTLPLALGPVFAPLDATVHSVANNATDGDYGPTIILEHEPEPGLRFFTLYGHLARESLAGLVVGRAYAAGERLARLGDASVNGGWPPHLHFQVITDLLRSNLQHQIFDQHLFDLGAQIRLRHKRAGILP